MTAKKIIIIDGGPRKTFNTASMLQKFAEGASSVSDEIEVKTVRLYGLDYKGCMSCMACKIKGKASQVCKFKDALTPILEDIADADGLVLGSPNYFGEVTGQMRAFLERLAFPWLSLQRLQHYRTETDARGVGGDAKRWGRRQQLQRLRHHGAVHRQGPRPAGEAVRQQHLSSEELRQFRARRFLGGSQTQVPRSTLGRRPAKSL